ncbi:ubiquinol oxidase subunit II [Pseudoroseomonas cervicalis]|uniref:ubiquinol oxidase subunit II n=1 Tax=Teichococcus cervicalis TaxID=204525 RepID=UPI0022F1B5DE|nr:ubiquinol oxidase subunit II [Pseudoroseomonas cervicalis]WBV44991.1 ubiquinol oxidase subunit II [Pseudoroseomonas cervicalis]
MRDTPASARRGWRPCLPLLPALPLLGGCQQGVLDPQGPIGLAEKSLMLTATWLMLLVVVPVIVMTLAFAWRYRAGNRAARYAPDWDHSGRIEAVVWAVPCAIILALAVITWRATHQLDPYRRIESSVPPVNVEVVALDWKWLFIYPDQGVAAVNEMALPVGTPVHFRITSGSVMNSFFIPQLGSQVYAMAGMVTQLDLLADAPGDYAGLSANYSGAGFSDMKFTAHASDRAGFEAWVARVRAEGGALDAQTYEQLSRPSERAPVTHYSRVTPDLFAAILRRSAPGGMMDRHLSATAATTHHAALAAPKE